MGAHRQQIESLNEAFETCRHAAYDPTLFPSAKSHLAGVLEDIAATHSELTPETADFQSRLDEWARSRTDPDLPF